MITALAVIGAVHVACDVLIAAFVLLAWARSRPRRDRRPGSPREPRGNAQQPLAGKEARA